VPLTPGTMQFIIPLRDSMRCVVLCWKSQWPLIGAIDDTRIGIAPALHALKQEETEVMILDVLQNNRLKNKVAYVVGIDHFYHTRILTADNDLGIFPKSNSVMMRI
jgi:hypothetical protein